MRFASLVVFLTIHASIAIAADNDWIGTNGDWSVPANWSVERLPTESDTVLIGNGGVFTSR